ncbi:hypothetical protein Dimus_038893 [Dionaea muscipula]
MAKPWSRLPQPWKPIAAVFPQSPIDAACPFVPCRRRSRVAPLVALPCSTIIFSPCRGRPTMDADRMPHHSTDDGDRLTQPWMPPASSPQPYHLLPPAELGKPPAVVAIIIAGNHHRWAQLAHHPSPVGGEDDGVGE